MHKNPKKVHFFEICGDIPSINFIVLKLTGLFKTPMVKITVQFWQNKTKLLTHIIEAYTQVFMGQIFASTTPSPSYPYNHYNIGIFHYFQHFL